MTDDPLQDCSCVVDCAGLHEIATTRSNNLKQLYLDRLGSGQIGVPSIVLKEFRDLYEDEANGIEIHIARKITMRKSYQMGAARIADQLNSGFPRGSYDSNTDLYTASIASIENIVLLTTTSQLRFYEGIECDVLDLESWAELPDE